MREREREGREGGREGSGRGRERERSRGSISMIYESYKAHWTVHVAMADQCL